jgi:GT2 family glycosyltransferase
MTPCASVVIPTYRRPDELERCLHALAGQMLGGRYEVIVADDAAGDATRDQVSRLVERFAANSACLRYVAVRGSHGPAAARNAGWRAARSEIIAFTDDDCLPDADWLAAGIRAIEAGADAVTGRTIVPLGSEPPTDFERETARLGEAEFLTANCFCLRSALEAVGGFDERFTTAWREDSDLHFTLLREGYRLVDEPEAVVVHPVRRAPWGVSLRQQCKSQFNALLYKKHPELYRRRIQPRPPLHYYAAIGSLAMAVIGAADRRRPVALAGAALWSIATARFCRRRMVDTSHRPAHVAEMVVTSAAIPPLSIFWRLRGAVRFRVAFV